LSVEFDFRILENNYKENNTTCSRVIKMKIFRSIGLVLIAILMVSIVTPCFIQSLNAASVTDQRDAELTQAKRLLDEQYVGYLGLSSQVIQIDSELKIYKNSLVYSANLNMQNATTHLSFDVYLQYSNETVGDTNQINYNQLISGSKNSQILASEKSLIQNGKVIRSDYLKTQETNETGIYKTDIEVMTTTDLEGNFLTSSSNMTENNLGKEILSSGKIVPVKIADTNTLRSTVSSAPVDSGDDISLLKSQVYLASSKESSDYLMLDSTASKIESGIVYATPKSSEYTADVDLSLFPPTFYPLHIDDPYHGNGLGGYLLAGFFIWWGSAYSYIAAILLTIVGIALMAVPGVGGIVAGLVLEVIGGVFWSGDIFMMTLSGPIGTFEVEVFYMEAIMAQLLFVILPFYCEIGFYTDHIGMPGGLLDESFPSPRFFDCFDTLLGPLSMEISLTGGPTVHLTPWPSFTGYDPYVTFSCYDEENNKEIKGFPITVNGTYTALSGYQYLIPPGPCSFQVGNSTGFDYYTVNSTVSFDNPLSLELLEDQNLCITAYYSSVPVSNLTVFGQDTAFNESVQADVFVDGQLMGETNEPLTLTIGMHQIRIDCIGWSNYLQQNVNFQSFSFNSFVSPQGDPQLMNIPYLNTTHIYINSSCTITAYFTNQSFHWLTINSVANPSNYSLNAIAYIDGQNFSRTPLSIYLPEGLHSIIMEDIVYDPELQENVIFLYWNGVYATPDSPISIDLDADSTFTATYYSTSLLVSISFTAYHGVDFYASYQADVDVYMDGSVIGVSDGSSILIPAGTHAFSVDSPVELHLWWCYFDGFYTITDWTYPFTFYCWGNTLPSEFEVQNGAAYLIWFQQY
jgi:hypothetical protein